MNCFNRNCENEGKISVKFIYEELMLCDDCYDILYKKLKCKKR
jgi:hypothetical protein